MFVLKDDSQVDTEDDFLWNTDEEVKNVKSHKKKGIVKTTLDDVITVSIIKYSMGNYFDNEKYIQMFCIFLLPH